MFIRKKIHFSIVLFFAIAGCNRQSYNIFNGEFKYVTFNGKVDSLIGEVVDIDGFGFWRTWIADTLFFMQNHRSENAFMDIYSLNSNKVLFKNLLLKGRGPNEYFEADMVHLYTDSTGIKAWISVNYREKLICVDITATIARQRLVLVREIELDAVDKFAIHSAFFDNDTSIVLQSIFHNDLISIYNPVSGTSRSMGWLYSQEYPIFRDIEIFSAYYVYNVQKSVLAGGMAFFDQINFYPLKKGAPFSISTNRNAIRYDNVMNIPQDEWLIYYGGGISYDEDMLFFTYGNGKRSSESLSATNNFLHIINWEGEMLKTYALDCHLFGHSYDKKTGYLYGVNIETDRILRYKINL